MRRENSLPDCSASPSPLPGPPVPSRRGQAEPGSEAAGAPDSAPYTLALTWDLEVVLCLILAGGRVQWVSWESGQCPYLSPWASLVGHGARWPRWGLAAGEPGSVVLGQNLRPPRGGPSQTRCPQCPARVCRAAQWPHCWGLRGARSAQERLTSKGQEPASPHLPGQGPGRARKGQRSGGGSSQRHSHVFIQLLTVSLSQLRREMSSEEQSRRDS